MDGGISNSTSQVNFEDIIRRWNESKKHGKTWIYGEDDMVCIHSDRCHDYESERL